MILGLANQKPFLTGDSGVFVDVLPQAVFFVMAA
jgi:hypothetical protein